MEAGWEAVGISWQQFEGAQHSSLVSQAPPFDGAEISMLVLPLHCWCREKSTFRNAVFEVLLHSGQVVETACQRTIHPGNIMHVLYLVPLRCNFFFFFVIVSFTECECDEFQFFSDAFTKLHWPTCLFSKLNVCYLFTAEQLHSSYRIDQKCIYCRASNWLCMGLLSRHYIYTF